MGCPVPSAAGNFTCPRILLAAPPNLAEADAAAATCIQLHAQWTWQLHGWRMMAWCMLRVPETLLQEGVLCLPQLLISAPFNATAACSNCCLSAHTTKKGVGAKQCLWPTLNR
jgi:hypothetical protein